MVQTLYRFGVDPSNPSTKAHSPTPICTASRITVLWSSWCDLIYSTVSNINDSSTTSIHYSGTSLTPTQRTEFTDPTSTISKALSNPQCHPSFFGSAMHDGVRGYICGEQITIFGTPAEELELGDEYQEISTWALPTPLAEVKVRSDGSVILALTASSNGTGSVVSLPNIQALKDYCSKAADVDPKILAAFAPTQLLTNAITSTALSPDGQVYTHTTDPRYPSTLGRSPTNTLVFEPIPYFSELTIAKIASGGYTTAAVSSEGELFLWGQANPGTEGELGVLHKLHYDQKLGSHNAVIWSDTEQDEYVKCLNTYIKGTEAAVEDVATGHGHMLVAARDEISERVVFAAGSGSEGQLGGGKAVDFVSEFEEVVALRGKRVTQMVAEGWSSFVVAEENANYSVGS